MLLRHPHPHSSTHTVLPIPVTSRAQASGYRAQHISLAEVRGPAYVQPCVSLEFSRKSGYVCQGEVGHWHVHDYCMEKSTVQGPGPDTSPRNTGCCVLGPGLWLAPGKVQEGPILGSSSSRMSHPARHGRGMATGRRALAHSSPSQALVPTHPWLQEAHLNGLHAHPRPCQHQVSSSSHTLGTLGASGSAATAPPLALIVPQPSQLPIAPTSRTHSDTQTCPDCCPSPCSLSTPRTVTLPSPGLHRLVSPSPDRR